MAAYDGVDAQQVGGAWTEGDEILSLSMSGDINVFDKRTADKPSRVLQVSSASHADISIAISAALLRHIPESREPRLCPCRPSLHLFIRSFPSPHISARCSVSAPLLLNAEPTAPRGHQSQSQPPRPCQTQPSSRASATDAFCRSLGPSTLMWRGSPTLPSSLG